jgi:phage shock protein A
MFYQSLPVSRAAPAPEFIHLSATMEQHTMALVTRISRLFQADFHAVLDRIEEPDLQLRQALREMQYALEQDQQRLQLLLHEMEQLDKATAVAGDRLQALDEELDICLAANKDDLARDLIRRKLMLDRQLQASTERSASLQRQSRSLARQVEEQTQQLTSMQQKLELLVNNLEQPGDAGLATVDTVRNEEIEIALLREKQRRSQA